MGQADSQEAIDPNTPPRTLTERSVDGVAELINSGRARRIVVMTGAGISTSAGIPDFRSPDTGLYANLARLNLPYPEAVFDISFFREKPEPFYVLAKELYPGKFYPTITHAFIALLNEKHKLRMLFTQNIDCLERQAGVPEELIVEAHGSFATHRCIECKTEFPEDMMKDAVDKSIVPHCLVPQCNGLVKPDIVFFGEALPERFHQNVRMIYAADLAIVMGTSLSVAPFATLPQLASEGVPRLLINKDPVGDFGSRTDDVMLLGDCDSGVRKLADALGWRDELEQLWLEVGGKVEESEAARLREIRKAMTKDELLQAEIEKITEEVAGTLQVSKDHMDSVIQALQKKQASAAKLKPSKCEDDPPAASTGLEPTLKNEVETEKPSSTPANNENEPINVEKVKNEAPAEAPSVNSSAILDVTLPQNKPNVAGTGATPDEKTSASKI